MAAVINKSSEITHIPTSAQHGHAIRQRMMVKTLLLQLVTPPLEASALLPHL